MSLPAVVLNDILNIQIFSAVSNQTVINTFNYQLVETPGGALIGWEAMYNLVADDLIATGGIVDCLKPAMATNTKVDYARLQCIAPTRVPYLTVGINEPGTKTGTCATANITASIERRASVPGRTGTGRVQIAGLVPADYADGKLTTAGINSLALMKTRVTGTITIAGGYRFDPVLTGVDPQSGLRHTSPIFNSSIKPELRTMSRRTVGRGI